LFELNNKTLLPFSQENVDNTGSYDVNMKPQNKTMITDSKYTLQLTQTCQKSQNNLSNYVFAEVILPYHYHAETCSSLMAF